MGVAYDLIITVLSVIKTIIYILFFLLFPMILAFIIQFIYLRKQGLKPRGLKKRKKKRDFLKRIFVLFPRQFLIDLFNKNSDEFPFNGLHLVCGEQGSGKTLTVMYLLSKWKKDYPRLVIRSNISITFQDNKLRSLSDVIQSNNDIYGQVEFFDEIQQEFDCLSSKNFPPQMLGEISQQRKQHKVILGTSQVFQRVAKPIREQVTFLYEPITVLGCLTIVRVSKPLCDDSGSIKSKKRFKTFFFVHSPFLRDCYDTYEKVERMSRTGFRPYNEQLGNYSSNRYTG